MSPPFFKTGILRLALVLAAYFVCRVFFFAWNYSMYHSETVWEIGRAFFEGVRFDISAILFFNAVLILIWMLPTRWLAKPWLRAIDWILFGLVNFICIGLNFIDVEFVRFVGKRLSTEYFLLHQDIEEQSAGIFLTYWKFYVGLFLLSGIVIWLYPKMAVARENWLSGTAWRLTTVVLVVIGMRGGFGLKPIHPMDAFFSTKAELGLLTLNTPFNMLKSTPSGEVIVDRYYGNDRDVIERVRNMTDLSRSPLGVTKGFNVVVLVLESFSLEDMGSANGYPGYMPFLDELAKKSYFFKYNFANSRRSVEGVPAVLCGIPAFMGEAIIMSDFVNDRLDCLPKILKQQGYSTYFLHGAHNGSMHFDTFSNIAGFDHFVGFNEFPDKSEVNVDPYWGIFDEPMLQYAANVISEAAKPVFLALFTLSSHHPYNIPAAHKGQFPKGENAIHESIGYSDYSLRKFFETAATKPWFNKTIFVLTADHVHPIVRPEYAAENELGEFRVPLIIYIPGLAQKLDASPTRITQHIDVLPSLLDLLGINKTDHFLLGQSVFDSAKTGRAYNYTSYGYWLIDPDYFVLYGRPDHKVRVRKHTETWHLIDVNMPNAQALALPEVKDVLAAAQYFNDGVVNDRFYTWCR